MQWQFIVALVLIVPIILFPVVFVWYFNIGGLLGWIHQRRKATRKDETPTMPITGRNWR